MNITLSWGCNQQKWIPKGFPLRPICTGGARTYKFFGIVVRLRKFNKTSIPTNSSRGVRSPSKFLWPTLVLTPVVYLYFWMTFRKGASKVSKGIRFSLKSHGVLRLCKTPTTVRYTTFWSFQKSLMKYLIKPVVYGYFWRPFRKKTLKSIKKH